CSRVIEAGPGFPGASPNVGGVGGHLGAPHVYKAPMSLHSLMVSGIFGSLLTATMSAKSNWCFIWSGFLQRSRKKSRTVWWVLLFTHTLPGQSWVSQFSRARMMSPGSALFAFSMARRVRRV